MSSNVPGLAVRPLRETDSLEDLTDLLHRAYAALADMGLKYVATYQDVEITRRRIRKGRCFVAEIDGAIVGTIVYKPPPATDDSLQGHDKGIAHMGQLAVEPTMQGYGIGGALIAQAEQEARSDGAEEIALDTAEPARHLIEWYERLGYRFVKYVQWDVTNYRSVIMSKRL